MDADFVLLAIVVVTALAFDFTNGFHDTANVVATSISTRAMAPKIAVGYAATDEFHQTFVDGRVGTPRDVVLDAAGAAAAGAVILWRRGSRRREVPT